MAIINPGGRGSDLADASAMSRAVADDMTAIFGTGVRSAEVPPPHRLAAAPHNRPRLIVGLAAVGLIAATVAAGMFAGKTVTTAPATAPTSRLSEQTRPAIGAEPSQSAGLAAPSFMSFQQAPTPVAAAAPVPVQQASAVRATPSPTAEATTPPRDPASRSALTPVPQDSSPAVRNEPVARAMPDRWRNGCDDDSETCLASQIEVADRQLGEAFDQAFAAGVRTRALQDRQREWDRAREESLEQPRDALRRYAIITSDLRNLAADASARGEVNIR